MPNKDEINGLGCFLNLLLAFIFYQAFFGTTPAYSIDEPNHVLQLSPFWKDIPSPRPSNYHRYFIKLKDKSLLDTAPLKNDGFSSIAAEKGYTMPARVYHQILKSSLLEEQGKTLGQIAKKLKFSAKKFDSRVSHKFNTLVNGFTGVFNDKEINKLASSSLVASVYTEQPVKVMLNEAVDLIKAPYVWQQDSDGAECKTSGRDCLEGKGVKIAVIDTGTDVTHRDLGSSILRERAFDNISDGLVTSFASVFNNAVQVDGDKVAYLASINTLKVFSFASRQTANIELPERTALIYDLKLNGNKAIYSLATGSFANGALYPESFKLYLLDTDSLVSTLIADKDGGFGFIGLDQNTVIFSAAEQAFEGKRAFYRYDISTKQEERLLEFSNSSGITPQYKNNLLIFGEIDSSGCINKFHQFSVLSKQDKIIFPPEGLAGGISDYKDDKLLFASCNLETPPDISLEYTLFDMTSGKIEKIAAPHPAVQTSPGAVIAKAKIGINKVFFQRGYNSGRIYIKDYSADRIVRLALTRSMRDFDINGDRACILFSDQTIGCHDYSSTADYPEQQNIYNSKVVGGFNFIEGDEEAIDDQGHGTHVAAIAAGNGSLKGVAPEADILSFKVLNQDGSGYLTDIITALERAFDPNGDGDISDRAQIASLSLGFAGNPSDPVAQMVDKAVANGMAVVVAAGNSGPTGNEGCRSPKDLSGQKFSICSPGVARQAITVGASTKSDTIAGFSSRGPVPLIDGEIAKPDIVAPGALICAAQWQNAFLPYASRCIDNQHVAISGTSMATPMVSGMLALVLQKRPELDGNTLKDFILARSSKDLNLPFSDQGHGRINAASAIESVNIINNPYIHKGGVVDSANYKAVAAPGSLVSIFGTSLSSDNNICQAETFPLPQELCGTSVRVNNITAPLLYVSPTQINFQMPFEAVTSPGSLGQKATVIVSTFLASSNNGEILVGEQAPAIYGQNGYPNGIAAATHLNNHPISFDEPAAPGEIVTLYITGLGQSQPQSATGEAATADPLLKTTEPEVIVGGVKAEVLFAGKAPGLAGTDQLNIKIPEDIADSSVQICGKDHCSNKLGFPTYSDKIGRYLPFGITVTTNPAFPAVVKKGSVIQVSWKITARPLPAEWKLDRRGVPQVKIQLYFSGGPLDILRTNAVGETKWEGSANVAIPTSIGNADEFYIRVEAVGNDGIGDRYFGTTKFFSTVSSLPQKTAFLKSVTKKYASKSLLESCQSQTELKYVYLAENYPTPGALLGIFGQPVKSLKVPVYSSNGKLICSFRKDNSTGLYSSLPCRGGGKSLKRLALKKSKADSMIYFGVPGQKNKKTCIGPFDAESSVEKY